MQRGSPGRGAPTVRKTGEVHYDIIDRPPSFSEHRVLAVSVGWEDHFDWETIGASIDASLVCVVAVADHEVIGMGRLVGDGVHYFYVQDVIVHPDHESSGVGGAILERLLQWIETHAPSKAFVGLFSSPQAVHLYGEYGFESADGESTMIGMHREVTPR